MILFKAYYHIKCLLIIIMYKIIYMDRLNINITVTFRDDFRLMIAKQGKVIIDDGVFFNNNCSIMALNKVTIGANTIIGENVKIYDHNHVFSNKDKLIKKQGFSVASVNIGKNCWLGSNVVILKKAVIGDNCVIGAGCVINQVIPSNSIVKLASNCLTITPRR